MKLSCIFVCMCGFVSFLVIVVIFFSQVCIIVSYKITPIIFYMLVTKDTLLQFKWPLAISIAYMQV